MAAMVSPGKIAFWICAALASVILLVGSGVLVSVDLANQAVNNEKVNEARLRLREAESSIRTAIPTCKAIVRMDKASHGASNASHSPNSYGHRLARAIHNVNTTSGCATLVREVNEGWTVTMILAAQEKSAKQH